MATPAKTSPCLRFGVFQADLERGELRKFGVPVKIQEKPFRVLAVLLERPGEVVSREELRERLWPANTFVEFDDGLNAAVKKLRAALNDTADRPHFIETVPKRGYRFVAPVMREEEPVPTVTDKPVTAPAQPERKTSFLQGRLLRFAIPGFLAAAVAAGLVYVIHRRVVQNQRAEAMQEVQQGRELWRKRTAPSLTQAIAHFNRAVELDPADARAYSGLADAYIVLPFLSTIRDDVAYPKAKAAAERAVQLGPDLAEAHTSLADVKLYVEWDFAGAEREFQRALALDSNYATAHQWYAEYLSLVGRHEEAIHEVLRAEQLEPTSVMMYHQAGQIYQNARQYDNAIHQYERALEIDPAFYPSCGQLAEAYRHKGMYEEWIQIQLGFLRRDGNSFYTPEANEIMSIEKIQQGLASGGKKGYWRARLEAVKATNESNAGRDIGDVPMYQLAISYAQNGDKDHAMYWMNELYKKHGEDILSIKVNPDYDPLRGDPRFQALVQRVGLP